MQETEITPGQVSVRRKVLAAIGILSLVSLFKMNIFSKKKPVIECGPEAENKTMKLLSRDGRLVEVDASKIKLVRKKISNEDLQNWIKKS
ncbi:MAG TPA: hypothetical protein VG738_01120 [Chitinophagaceae bacterium]|nr:hypothetical protein [Chitinophagaceae bacterium]